MASRSRLIATLALFLIPLLLSGCITYQLLGGVEGGEVSYPSDRLVVGETTLGEVLVLLGAPDTVGRVDEGDLLIYQRAVLKRNRLSLGIPTADIWRLGIDLSAYGSLVRYDRLVVGKTTLGEVLVLLGAPDKVGRVNEGDLLIYQRAVLKRNRLSLGIPLADIWRLGFDLSAYGSLVRYDRLVLLFTPEGILSGAAFEKSSDHPYWKAMTSDS